MQPEYDFSTSIETPYTEDMPPGGSFIVRPGYVILFSPSTSWPIYVKPKLISLLGGVPRAHAELYALHGGKLLPRRSSAAHPYGQTDYMLAMKNKALGYRHWRHQGRFIAEGITYRGYGFWDGDSFQFWDIEKDAPSALAKGKAGGAG
jgi:hypothetical protein